MEKNKHTFLHFFFFLFFIKITIFIAPRLEGVFRISAMKSALVEAQEKIDAGHRIEFSDLTDPHIGPALFKQFLRELPEPLLTFELYPEFIKANCKLLWKKIEDSWFLIHLFSIS